MTILHEKIWFKVAKYDESLLYFSIYSHHVLVIKASSSESGNMGLIPAGQRDSCRVVKR